MPSHGCWANASEKAVSAGKANRMPSELIGFQSLRPDRILKPDSISRQATDCKT
ncbi:hypothetical protein Poly21_05080 [Allorhodopirellula heiligendammensis]|uniref:Uncharacterized protein n=1 Tax=Allorhodopirellula heiligendammensis TaxID=2714739 RepID=A0A5C6C499_9BACT|nr:hypothetical protein Poly21_05080 [Allorhodopirellula heiligendammensis]